VSIIPPFLTLLIEGTGSAISVFGSGELLGKGGVGFRCGLPFLYLDGVFCMLKRNRMRTFSRKVSATMMQQVLHDKVGVAIDEMRALLCSIRSATCSTFWYQCLSSG